MEFSIEKCAMLIMKSGKKQHITERIELPNQERIRALEGNENYKYLVILEADKIEQVEIKENIQKSITDERESFSKPSSATKILSKG